MSKTVGSCSCPLVLPWVWHSPGRDSSLLFHALEIPESHVSGSCRPADICGCIGTENDQAVTSALHARSYMLASAKKMATISIQC